MLDESRAVEDEFIPPFRDDGRIDGRVPQTSFNNPQASQRTFVSWIADDIDVADLPDRCPRTVATSPDGLHSYNV